MKKALVLLLTLLLSFSSFAAFAESAGPAKGGTIVVGLSYEPDTLNVYATHLLGDVHAVAVEGLLVPGADMEYEPVLAVEVPTVENGLITLNDDGTMDIKYNLQQNVFWHDGEKFTSEDVKVTWEKLKDDAWECESKDGVFDIDSIECPDDYTVICHYNRQTMEFAQCLFTFGIMPAHLIADADMNDVNNAYNSTMIGTGPYKFVEWVPGEYMYFEANKNYWREGAYLDGIYFRFIPDENTRITMLKAGEIDFTFGISCQNYPEVENIAGTRILTQSLNSWVYMDFNTTVPGLSDEVVRQAISMGIDKQALVDQLFSSIPIIWYQPWMPTDPYHVENFQTKHGYNPQAAIALLEENGWVLNSENVREKDGVKLAFDISCGAGNAEREAIELVAQAQLSQIGIKLNINNMAASTLSANMWDGKYQIALGGYITSPGASRTLFYAKDGYLNRGKWMNDEFSELCAKIDASMDEGERKALVAQAAEVFDMGLPQIVLYNKVDIVVANEKLKGVELNATNMTHFCHAASWYLEQ